MSIVVVKINDCAIPSESDAVKDHCELRTWCHSYVKGKWHSYFLHTTEENLRDGVGFVAFNFADPKEALKFKLWAGA